MKCPDCQQNMDRGRVQVRGSFLGFLVVGFSAQDLYFDQGRESDLVLGTRERRDACQCAGCGGVFIVGARRGPRTETDPSTGVVTEYEAEA